MKPFILFLSFLLLTTGTISGQERQRVCLNREWKFMLGDVQGAEQNEYADLNWTDTHLPHSFSIPYFMWKDVYHGYGWYRKHINVPEEWAGKRVFIEFEGSFIDTEVYINGVQVGQHVGGYTSFDFDLTPYLHTGDNVLAVRINNLWNAQVPPRAGDHQFSGGIYRDVWLHVISPIHIPVNGTFFYGKDVTSESATPEATIELVNDLTTQQTITLHTDILTPTGRVACSADREVTLLGRARKSVTQQFPTISKPSLWSPETPYRYKAVTTLVQNGLVIDRYTTRFGFRSMVWTADRGFFLNGQHYYLLGANVHQDQAGWGDAVTNGAIARDVKLIKDAGFNCIRGSHYPHDPAFAEACDSLGIILFMELNFWGMGGHGEEGAWGEGAPASSYPTIEADQKPFEKSVLQQLKEEIRVHRNSPSIAAWSLCNEAFFCASSTDEKVKNLLNIETDSARAWDPTREVAIGGCQRKGLDKPGKGQIAFYNGDGASIPEFQNPGVPNLVSEYSCNATDRPSTFSPQWGDIGDGMTNRPAWRSGQVIWCGFDHGTLAGYGLAKTGIIDYFRLPKRPYYWYQQVYRDGRSQAVEPTWPQEGIPAKLQLEASQAVIPSCNGTDDAQLIVTILDAEGKHISNNRAVTLDIVSGPGEFPTGRSITFLPPSDDPASDIRILDGQAAITFRSYYAGTTIIRATSEGLESADITITTLGSPTWIEAAYPVCENRPYSRYVASNDKATTVFTLASHRPTWSSSDVSTKFSKAKANDENVKTYWQAAKDDTSPWWLVSLEATYNLSRIELVFPQAKAYQYVIEVSKDREQWIPVVDQSASTSTDKVRTAEGNFGTDIGFVRIRFTSAFAALSEVRLGGTLGGGNAQ